MSTRQRKQSKLKPLLLPVCCLFVLGYFAYHAVEGDYGLFALGKLQDRVAVARGGAGGGARRARRAWSAMSR